MTETMHFSLILNHYVQIQEMVKTNDLKIIFFVIEAKWPENATKKKNNKDKKQNPTNIICKHKHK